MLLKFIGKSIAALTLCSALMAGTIDGKWDVQMVAKPEPNSKKAAKNKGKTKGKPSTLELKSEGKQLQGSVIARKRDAAPIEKGVFDGEKFSFTSKMTTKKGERTVYWQGTVDGSELKGKMSPRQGGKGGQEFIAKKAA